MKAIVLRKVAGRLQAMILGFGMKVTPAATDGPPLSSLAFGLSLLLLPIVAILLIAVMLLVPHGASGLVLATAPAILPRKTRADLDLVIKSIEKLDKEYEGKQMPEDVTRKYNELMAEGESLSEAINAEVKNQKAMERMRGARQALGEVVDPVIPSNDTKADDAIVGYITPGDLVVVADEYKAWADRGAWRKKGDVYAIDIKGSMLGSKRSRMASRNQGVIALTAPEVKALKEVYGKIQTKDLPVFGDLVIAPSRVDRFVQDTRPEVLTLRDVLNVSPTSSNLIQYVAEVAFTSGADIQSEGVSTADTALKGESDIEYELRDAPIRTIATTIPVSEQQLSDAPALINRINTRLLHAVKLKEEQLMGYGAGGASLEFAGFFDSDSGISAATTPSGSPTLIDKIRAAQTDVFTAGYNPTFVWIHPVDWETIELTKGSDGHYIWAIIRDTLGPRIWSMRVVQGIGTKKAGATLTNVLVGDADGAVIYDREQNNIAIGWIDDQFARNLRTIRAEERMTLTIDAPAAFRKIETAS